MSVATAPQNGYSATHVALIEKEVKFVPLGESDTITLSINMVRKWLVKPTRSGNMPTDADIMQFIMMCKARELNPWVGDAYCVGYDSKDGPTFNLITSVQALFKRADAHPQYDGIESGVIVKTKDGSIEDRVGDWYDEGETLVGGWARVYRKDRARPFEERIKLASFNKNRSVWLTDPAGMISKNAEAGGLRKAFPTQLGGLYLREEMERNRIIEGTATEVHKEMDRLSSELAAKRGIEHQPENATFDAEQSHVEQQQEPEAVQQRPKQQQQQQKPAKQEQQPEPEVKQPDGGGSEDVIVADFKDQIEAIECEEDAQAISLAVKRSSKLDAKAKEYLSRLLSAKMAAFSGS